MAFARSHRCRSVVTAIVFVSSLVAIPIIATPSPAQAVSCGTEAKNFDGTNDVPQTNYYVSADITTNVPTFCGNSNGLTAVWAMMADSASGGYAQSGYLMVDGDTVPFMFAEYSQSGASFTLKIGNEPPSGSPRYDEIYDFNAADIEMYVDNDSTLLATTPFDPAVVWTAPWVPYWSGETNFPGDSMPGTASNPTYFSNMLIKKTRGGSTVAPSGLSVSSTYSNYGAAWDTTDSKFHIWTK